MRKKQSIKSTLEEKQAIHDVLIEEIIEFRPIRDQNEDQPKDVCAVTLADIDALTAVTQQLNRLYMLVDTASEGDELYDSVAGLLKPIKEDLEKLNDHISEGWQLVHGPHGSSQEGGAQ